MVHVALKVVFFIIFLLIISAFLFVPLALMVTLKEKTFEEMSLEEEFKTTVSSEPEPNAYFCEVVLKEYCSK